MLKIKIIGKSGLEKKAHIIFIVKRLMYFYFKIKNNDAFHNKFYSKFYWMFIYQSKARKKLSKNYRGQNKAVIVHKF